MALQGLIQVVFLPASTFRPCRPVGRRPRTEPAMPLVLSKSRHRHRPLPLLRACHQTAPPEFPHSPVFRPRTILPDQLRLSPGRIPMISQLIHLSRVRSHFSSLPLPISRDVDDQKCDIFPNKKSATYAR